MWHKRGLKTGKYRSRLEAKAAVMMASVDGLEYEKTKLSYTLLKNYLPDFRVGNIVIEVKGFFDSPDRTKIRKVREEHPEIDLRMFFGDFTKKIHKNSKTSYKAWCEKQGILCCQKVIPNSWIIDLQQEAKRIKP
ncbi:endodeoxyribonuclease [Candidatus Wolfebacteria bacterium]|nr:MAG: endodeoxyribonuclease [Candidatus Wolfebacteria bacterium]